MRPDRWHQVTEIFHAARARPANDRQAFLDHACASDPSLRRQVDAMMDAHNEAGTFGESPLPPPQTTARHLSSGTMLREFRIESLIGAGGMGEVYRATDTVLGRAVAIKVLPDAVVDDPDRLARLDREARVLASINHPHIAAIYALVEAPPRGDERASGKALVLELIEGSTLADRLRSDSDRSRRALSIGESLDLAQQIAAALEAAHEKGIIHRDLKPANIALTHDGTVKVLDFGLAKPVDPTNASAALASLSASSTREGTIVGTAAYMSPEQARGSKVDKRTDVWAFGCVVYEMLTGRRAFAGDTVSDTLAAVLEREPDWSALPPDTPRHVRRLLIRTLQRNVAQRLRDIGDARLELSQPLDVDHVVSAAPSRVPLRRVGIGALVLAAVATGMFFVGRQLGTSSQPAVGAAAPVFRQLTFRRGAIPAARFAADGRNIVYSASWDGRPPEMFTGSLDRPESRPLEWPSGILLAISRSNEVALSLGCTSDPNFEIGCGLGILATAPLTGGAPRELSTAITYAEWTPGGELAVVRSLSGRTRLELPVGRVVHEAPVIRLPRINAEGTLIAATTQPSGGGEEALVVITREGQARTLSSGWQGISGLAWSPAGDEIWFTGTRAQQSALHAIDLDGRERQVLNLPTKVRLYDTSASGAVLLGTEVTSNVTVLNGPDDDVERPYSWFDRGWAVGLSADGRYMLFNERGRAVEGRSTMYLRATDAKSAATRLGEGRALALSANGKMALAVRSTPSGEQLVLLPTGAGDPAPLARGAVERYESSYAAFFDDGRRVLFFGYRRGEGLRAFVQESPSQDPRAITPDLAYVGNPGVISPDMQWVAASVVVAPRDVHHLLFPVAGGEPQPLPELPTDFPPMQWTPDGSELYARRWAPWLQQPESDLILFSLRTRKMRPVRTIRVSDPAGSGFPRGMMLTRDGRTYTYNYPQTLQDLHVVTGLR